MKMAYGRGPAKRGCAKSRDRPRETRVREKQGQTTILKSQNRSQSLFFAQVVVKFQSRPLLLPKMPGKKASQSLFFAQVEFEDWTRVIFSTA